MIEGRWFIQAIYLESRKGKLGIFFSSVPRGPYIVE